MFIKGAATALVACVTIIAVLGHIVALRRDDAIRAFRNLMIAYILFESTVLGSPVTQLVRGPVAVTCIVVPSMYTMVQVIQFGRWIHTTRRR